ncbi:MAG: ORF6N domain-containing protein [Selenomonadaceae bacterium]|nr:ORF6N domain-containing protein [Selenomonadaceae bacterium]
MKNIKELVPVDYSNQRVLTTAQVAEAYETSVNNIKKNFNANKEQFTEGVHYFNLTGDALREFKNRVTHGDLVGARARSLLLWTEHGALLHCKMINTDAAWKVFQDLSNFYFAHRNDDTDALKAEIAALKKENAALKANRPVAKPIPLDNWLKFLFGEDFVNGRVKK